MLPLDQVTQQMQTTRVPARQVSSDLIASNLERNGFLRDIAGDADFNKAVKAVQAMFANGRGLFVTGEAGCGKTQLLRAIKKWLHPNTNLLWYYCKEPKDISYLRYNDDETMSGNIFIDDIGCEEIIKEYGNTIDVIGDFVQRYHYRGKGRFFGSTNLHSSQFIKKPNGEEFDTKVKGINEIYGGRFLDRIMEMCVVLKMDGDSKRKRIIIK